MTKILNFAPSSDGKVLDITLYGILFGDWFTGSEEEQAMSAIRSVSPDTEIRVHINSDGGDTMAGVAFYNVLAAHPGPVVCLVEGLAASAASIVAMAGRTVMGRGTIMMVHNPWSIIAGGAEDLRAQADLLDKVRDAIATIYEKKTGKSIDEIKALLAAETWMGAEEAVAAGFADEIANEEPPQVTAETANNGSLNLITFTCRNGAVAFPRERMPAQVLAMAKPVVKPETVTEQTPLDQPAPADPAAAPADPVTPVIDRAYLAEKHPEIVAALLDEGRAAERTRLQELDELPVTQASLPIINAAKYGDERKNADQVARAILKAQTVAPSEDPRLAARRNESKPVAGIVPSAIDQTTKAEAERQAAKEIAAHANSRRGGVR